MVKLDNLLFYIGNKCVTNRGPHTDKLCLFPFKFQGKTYHECTTDSYGTKPWCPTWLDKEDYHGKNYWGFCSPECPGYDEGGIAQDWF